MAFQYNPAVAGGSKADNSSGINLLLSLLMKQPADDPGAAKTGLPTALGGGQSEAIMREAGVDPLLNGPKRDFSYDPQLASSGAKGMNGY